FGEVKDNDRELDGLARVIRKVELEGEPTISSLPLGLDEAAVLGRFGLNRPKDSRKVLILDEEDECRPGISPGQVAEQLIEGFLKRFGPSPDLAFSHQDIVAFLPNQDVRLALLVEGFPSSAWEMGAKNRNNMVSQRLLVLVRIGSGVTFHRPA